MSWLQKLLPPKIKRGDTSARNKSIPEGLWSKCDATTVMASPWLNSHQLSCQLSCTVAANTPSLMV